MPATRLIAASAALALGLTACGPSIQVRTLANPDVGIGSRRTFRI